MRHVLSLALVATAASSLASAQSFLADQFIGNQPGISATVFQQLGQDACRDSNGTFGPWSSFMCLKFSCLYSGCAAEVIGDHMSGIDAAGSFFHASLRPTTPGPGKTLDDPPDRVKKLAERNKLDPAALWDIIQRMYQDSQVRLVWALYLLDDVESAPSAYLEIFQSDPTHSGTHLKAAGS